MTGARHAKSALVTSPTISLRAIRTRVSKVQFTSTSPSQMSRPPWKSPALGDRVSSAVLPALASRPLAFAVTLPSKVARSAGEIVSYTHLNCARREAR